MDEGMKLVIGTVSLPVFAALILWVAHKLGMSEIYDKPLGFVIALAFAMLVVTLQFFPEYSNLIVGAVTMIYTLLTTWQKFVPESLVAVFGTREQKMTLAARIAR
ncbi:MAG: hypothetical protein HY868_25620 [Chloroflexi bacterium]|nr:hypothetical protein [Chloroflexota bacterium]